MVITDDIMRRDTIELLKLIDVQIEQIEHTAKRMGICGGALRVSDGTWPMVNLLQAKAQAYNTLVMLQTKK